MNIVVSTHQGILYKEEVDYVVVRNDEGEFAILENHIPVISIINEGYVKLVKGQDAFYVVIISGILEFSDNNVNVLAQEAHIGRDSQSARDHLEEFRKERLEQNRKEQVDLTQKEKELREHLKTSKAGHL